MKLIVRKDEKSWVEAINGWLEDRVKKFKLQRLFVPAGETPRPLYSAWTQHPPEFLKSLSFVQLDEILTGSHKGSFRQFFLENLSFCQTQFEFIDAAEKGADLALLGLGSNGHVAFHEPGFEENFYSGCVHLNVETIARLKLEPGTRAVTYGLGAFLKTKSILIIVRGNSKCEILKKILEPSCRLPGALLLKHQDVTIIADFEI